MSILEMFEHAGLSGGHADRERFAVRYAKFDDIRAVGPRAVDHILLLSLSVITQFFQSFND